MVDKINEVSETLGFLKANITVLLDGQKQINDKLTLMNGSITKAHKRSDDIEDRLDREEETSEDYKNIKKKAILGIVGLSGASGFGGTKLALFFQNLFSGG